MCSFHARLLELESEILAKEEAQEGISELTPDCSILLDSVEEEIGVKLGDKVPKDFRGWISYRRFQNKSQGKSNDRDQVIINRGRAFKVGGLFPKYVAGCDVSFGLDTATEYQRGFDVSCPQDLDHLLVNFGRGKQGQIRVFLWYGENIAPYRLIFEAVMADDPQDELREAVVEACHWIIKKPKEMTLPEFLSSEQG